MWHDVVHRLRTTETKIIELNRECVEIDCRSARYIQDYINSLKEHLHQAAFWKAKNREEAG
jgi:hypothetical protein